MHKGKDLLKLEVYKKYAWETGSGGITSAQQEIANQYVS